MREWLRSKRTKANFSQSKLSRIVKISQNHYSNIESGNRTPSVSIAKRIAEILDFDWTLFYEDSEQEKSRPA